MPTQRVLEYFLYNFDNNGNKLGPISSRSAEDFIRAVRVRSSNPTYRPKKSGGLDRVIFLLKKNKKEFLFNTNFHNILSNGKIVLITDPEFDTKSNDIGKSDLEDFVTNGQRQVDYINSQIQTWGNGPWSIIQEPWDPDVIPPQEIGDKENETNQQPKSDQKEIDDKTTKEEVDKQLQKDPKTINSKITLKKKSGPGELVGVTELDSENGLVSFSGLQFTEPGDYVISVIPSSSELEATEINFKIEPADEILEQDSRGQDEPITGTRPIISQIDEPTIKLEPMSVEKLKSDEDNKNITTGLGFLPFVFYNKTYQISERYIRQLSIFYDEFVPKCVLTFQDQYGLMNTPETAPTANTPIDIFFNSGSDKLKSVHLRFLIDQKKDNKNKTMTVYGKLDLRDFYKIQNKSYTGTSFDVLRLICKELGLGFNSNILQTNDSMKWIRSNTNLEIFIRDMISKSYISDDSFMIGYIDYYYCFNYVDVEKEYNRDNSNDVAIQSSGLSHIAKGSDQEKITKLTLTNDKGAASSPFYFTKFEIKNNSTLQLTKQGATTDSKFYDRIKKIFVKSKVDVLTSPDENLKTLRDIEDVDTNYRTDFTGKIDMDNVHENYLYAKTQNKRNLINLANIMANITLPNPNFNLYKFQKVKVIKVNDRQTVSEPDKIDRRYTGDWIIIDISFNFSNGILVQNLVIARKELTKTEDEINNQTTAQDNSQNGEINENEITQPTPAIPNSIYTVGQEVKIEQNGKVYKLIVEKVSDSGIEISGKIVETLEKIPDGSEVTTSEVEPQLDTSIKSQLLSVTYNDNGNNLTADATFLIEDKVEVQSFGTAQLTSEGKAKQKEKAVFRAQVSAVNKYKANPQTTTPTTENKHTPTGAGTPAQNATASSKKGYTYEIVTVGINKSVIVKDNNGIKILQTPNSTGITDEKLIENAKIAAGDI